MLLKKFINIIFISSIMLISIYSLFSHVFIIGHLGCFAFYFLKKQNNLGMKISR